VRFDIALLASANSYLQLRVKTMSGQ